MWGPSPLGHQDPQSSSLGGQRPKRGSCDDQQQPPRLLPVLSGGDEAAVRRPGGPHLHVQSLHAELRALCHFCTLRNSCVQPGMPVTVTQMN